MPVEKIRKVRSIVGPLKSEGNIGKNVTSGRTRNRTWKQNWNYAANNASIKYSASIFFNNSLDDDKQLTIIRKWFTTGAKI